MNYLVTVETDNFTAVAIHKSESSHKDEFVYTTVV